VVDRWPAARPFALIGSAAIIAGGVVAAVSRPTGFELGSWLAAFLVLVGGVAQIVLGVGQAWIAHQRPRARDVRAEVVWWNLGLGATVLGSLAAVPIATTVGGAAIVVALCLFLRGVRGGGSAAGWTVPTYRAMVVVVVVSVPIGIALAWLRHG
jgi:hypothetical protein